MLFKLMDTRPQINKFPRSRNGGTDDSAENGSRLTPEFYQIALSRPDKCAHQESPSLLSAHWHDDWNFFIPEPLQEPERRGAGPGRTRRFQKRRRHQRSVRTRKSPHRGRGVEPFQSWNLFEHFFSPLSKWKLWL